MDLLTIVKECRACQCTDLEDVVDLGNQYVVDFVKEPGNNLQAPLVLALCKNCGLLQLRHSVWRDRLYKKMWYRSGINEQMRQALREVANRAYLSVEFEPGDRVLDIGCNDGTLLEQYPAFRSIQKVGVDPCKERVQEGVDAKRMEIGLVGYFGTNSTFARLQQLGEFKVITAVAMFYDVEDPVGFLIHCRELLDKDGVVIIQQNYLAEMLKSMAFDNISHEHLCYYSLSVMKRVIDAAGLHLAGVETNNVNGGSFRVYLTKNGKDLETPRLSHNFRMQLYTNELQMLKEEQEMQLDSVDTYRVFEHRKNEICRVVREYLAQQMARGKRIHVYGASTRGTTTMQCLDLPETMVQHMKAAERDNQKFGLKMVGTWIPIVSEIEARKEADIFLVLPFHFFDGIKIREREFLRAGGEFVVPLPVPRVVVEDGERFLLEQLASEVIQ